VIQSPHHDLAEWRFPVNDRENKQKNTPLAEHEPRSAHGRAVKKIIKKSKPSGEQEPRSAGVQQVTVNRSKQN